MVGRMVIAGLVFCVAMSAFGADKKTRNSVTPLERYLALYSAAATPDAPAAGSLWRQNSSFTELGSDLRARAVNDLITIRIAEQTLAEASAGVSAARKLKASSAIDTLAGRVNPGGISPVLSLQSDESLNGKGQANSQTRLRTSVAGRVAAVLPNGVMVVEADRKVRLNNETQTIVLRGMVRPADVLSDNTVLSTSLANLEIELKGKGVVSDSTRPPNPLMRVLLWLTGF